MTQVCAFAHCPIGMTTVGPDILIFAFVLLLFVNNNHQLFNCIKVSTRIQLGVWNWWCWFTFGCSRGWLQFFFIYLLHFSTLHHGLGKGMNLTNRLRYHIYVRSPCTCYHDCWPLFATLKILIGQNGQTFEQRVCLICVCWLVNCQWHSIFGD